MMGLAEPSRAARAAAPMEGVVCAILRAEARRGFDDEFAALMSDLAHHIRTDEPGCQSYVVTLAMGSLAHFVMHARFDDWRAFEAHAETPLIKRLMPRLNALLASPIAMELFLEV